MSMADEREALATTGDAELSARVAWLEQELSATRQRLHEQIERADQNERLARQNETRAIFAEQDLIRYRLRKPLDLDSDAAFPWEPGDELWLLTGAGSWYALERGEGGTQKLVPSRGPDPQKLPTHAAVKVRALPEPPPAAAPPELPPAKRRLKRRR